MRHHAECIMCHCLSSLTPFRGDLHLIFYVIIKYKRGVRKLKIIDPTCGYTNLWVDSAHNVEAFPHPCAPVWLPCLPHGGLQFLPTIFLDVEGQGLVNCIQDSAAFATYTATTKMRKVCKLILSTTTTVHIFVLYCRRYRKFKKYQKSILAWNLR